MYDLRYPISYAPLLFPEMQGVDCVVAIGRLAHEHVDRKYLPIALVDTGTVPAFVGRASINELETLRWVFAKENAQNQFGMGSLQRLKVNVLGVNDQFNGFGKTRG